MSSISSIQLKSPYDVNYNENDSDNDEYGDNDNEQKNLSEEELRARINEYITFIDNILQPELEKAVANREEIEFEIQEYNELKIQIQGFINSRIRKKKQIQDSTCIISDDGNLGKEGEQQQQQQNQEQKQMSLVDLGCQKIAYCQAEIKNPNTIFVDVMKGIHVELTLEESIPFIKKRITFLETYSLPRRVEKAKTVARHLEDSLSLLESLGKEMSSMES